jgi:hypothetical protein
MRNLLEMDPDSGDVEISDPIVDPATEGGDISDPSE